MNYVNPNAYGPEGMRVPDAFMNRAVELPAGRSRHFWVSTAVFAVSPAAVDRAAAAYKAGEPAQSLDLDHENLITIQGPACLKCGADVTPDNAAELCPVVIAQGPDDLPPWLRDVGGNGNGPGA